MIFLNSINNDDFLLAWDSDDNSMEILHMSDVVNYCIRYIDFPTYAFIGATKKKLVNSIDELKQFSVKLNGVQRVLIKGNNGVMCFPRELIHKERGLSLNGMSEIASCSEKYITLMGKMYCLREGVKFSLSSRNPIKFSNRGVEGQHIVQGFDGFIDGKSRFVYAEIKSPVGSDAPFRLVRLRLMKNNRFPFSPENIVSVGCSNKVSSDYLINIFTDDVRMCAKHIRNGMKYGIVSNSSSIIFCADRSLKKVLALGG